MFSRVIFGLLWWASRKGLAPEGDGTGDKHKRRQTGIKGETFAYWYLRRHGYVIIARNFIAPGLKGEIDIVGYDGNVLAFVEVKTRTGESELRGLPEDAVTPEKQRRLARMARRFMADWRIKESGFRFDVVAIESLAGRPPVVRLHKGAFVAR